MGRLDRSRIYHIPICPFSQRVEILLALKQCEEAVDFEPVDITIPRPRWLLELTGGRSAMPVLVLPSGEVIAESLNILAYLDAALGDTHVAASEPALADLENGLVALAGSFADAGYAMILNRDRSRRDALVQVLLDQYAKLDDLLNAGNPGGHFAGPCFGYAETVFTPLFQRFAFLEYYECFALPGNSSYSRVARWQSACVNYPLAQQVTREQIIKLYYDYAQGAPDGALPSGRYRSSLSFLPHWTERPWPPHEKYGRAATDAMLGLVYADLDPRPALASSR
jgi:glutathione S-transferase